MTRPIGPGERAAYDNALRSQEQRIDELLGLLREVAGGVIDSRHSPDVLIVIHHTTWTAIRAAIA